MWICPICNRHFTKSNLAHSCNEKTLDDFLNNRSMHTTELFYHFIKEYKCIGNITVHPTKSMIALGGKTKFAYITQLGRDFMDVVFSFKEPYDDNLCFIKIRSVPGGNDHNHYFRMCFNEDINEEVKGYMKLAFENSLK